MTLWLELTLAVLSAGAIWLILSKALFYRQSRSLTGAQTPKRVEFTLVGDRVVRMSDTAMSLLEAFKSAPNRQDILDHLGTRFVELNDLDLTQNIQNKVIPSAWRNDDGMLCVSAEGDRIDLVLTDHAGIADLYGLRQRANTLSLVETAVETTRLPIWQSTPDGEILMKNLAYRTLDDKIALDLHAAARAQTDGETRLCVTGTDGKQRWYDVERHSFQDRTMFYAIDATEVVKAEQAQRNFVQTLTKTFATLSTGLAIFDRNRQLVLFNPALVDLTKLPAEFLSTRPNLLSLFDRLRDKHIMPEPKNYASWREELGHVVVAAAEGTYSEIWNLPSGETYRIVGRPHPDGALAFLFEDITAEVSKTRKYRSELDFHHALLDQIDTAVAVFSVSGQLCMTNDAHDDLWSGFDHCAQQTILDASRLWQSQSQPSPFWGDLRDFVHQLDERITWSGNIALPDGTKIDCQVIPLPDHHTAVTFQKTRDLGTQSAKLQLV